MLEGRGARRPTPKRALRIRDVHFALENNGWNCTLECEMHLSTSGSTRRGRRPTPRHPSRGPRRRRLSESVAKAPIAPRRTKRIVDIPRFFSPSIPARSAFATDSDMTPPHAPHINARERQLTRENVCWSHVLAGYPAISSTRTSTPRSPEQPRRPVSSSIALLKGSRDTSQSSRAALRPRKTPFPRRASGSGRPSGGADVTSPLRPGRGDGDGRERPSCRPVVD